MMNASSEGVARDFCQHDRKVGDIRSDPKIYRIPMQWEFRFAFRRWTREANCHEFSGSLVQKRLRDPGGVSSRLAEISRLQRGGGASTRRHAQAISIVARH